MKILVVSDSHGNYDTLNKIVKINKDINTIIHLGDGENDTNKLLNEYPTKNIIRVRGNCDHDTTINNTYEGIINNKKIFATHGHLFNVKNDLLYITNHAKNKNVNIILFGHTHLPLNIFYDNMYIVNPGTLRPPISTYAILNIENDDTSVKISKL